MRIEPADEDAIDLVMLHLLDQALGEALHERYRHQGKCLAELADDAWDQRVEGHGARISHADAALLATCRAPGGFKRIVDLREHAPGIVEKCAAGIGQFNPARLAAEQLHIEFALNRLDLSAERRRLHIEAFRGPRDISLLR